MSSPPAEKNCSAGVPPAVARAGVPSKRFWLAGVGGRLALAFRGCGKGNTGALAPEVISFAELFVRYALSESRPASRVGPFPQKGQHQHRFHQDNYTQ
jgi:hypothetical protein